MIPTSSRTVISGLLGTGVILGFGTPVLAVAVPPPSYINYNITHGFSFNVGGNTTPGVRGYDGGGAFTSSPFVGSSSSSYGHSYTISPPVPSLPFVHNHSTSASTGGASATASSKVQINTIGVGTVAGLINASGTATVQQRGEIACAGSYAGVTARQRIRLPFGVVVWGPRFNWDFVGGGGCAIRKDPIKFTVTDPGTGEVLQSGQFLDITSTGDGSVNWDDDSLDFAISDGTFSIDLNSPFIPEKQQGTLLLKVQEGIITDAQDTGIFEGYLPVIGESGNFSIPLATPNLTFDYNLGDFGKEVDLELTADGGAVSVPEPSTMTPLSLGILGLILLGWKQFWGDSSEN